MATLPALTVAPPTTGTPVRNRRPRTPSSTVLPATRYGGQARAINDSGVIAGFVSGPEALLAVRWWHGRSVPLGTLPGGDASAALNNRDARCAFLGEAMTMNDREKTRTEQETRGSVRGSRRITAYGQAINRYLGAFSYVDPYADRTPAAERRVPAACSFVMASSGI